MARIYWWLLLPLTLGPPLAALDPLRKPWQYSVSAWSDREGLPQNTVRCLAQTSEGYVWAGTEGGLARFNGRRFTVFDRVNTPELGGATIQDLAAGEEGVLWIGTSSGLVRYQAGRFERFKTPGITRLAPAGGGRLWLGTNAGVVEWDGRRMGQRIKEGLPAGAVRALAPDGAALWIGTAKGLARREADGRVRAVTGVPADNIRTIIQDRSGRWWVGTESSGLLRMENREAVARPIGPPGISVRDSWAGREGELWVATLGHGLLRWTGNSFEMVPLPSEHVRTLLEDREGNLWAGMEAGGLAKLTEGSVIPLTRRDGLGTDLVRAVRGDTGGGLWVGTEGAGLYRYEQGRLRPVDRLGLPRGFITALLEDRRGRLWVGTEGNGGYCLEKTGRRTAYSTTVGPVANTVWALAEDARGAVWLGTSTGLLRVDAGGGRKLWTAADGLGITAIRALHAAADGSVWIAGLSSGLGRLAADGRFEAVQLPAGAGTPRFTSFAAGEEGLWITSNQGLYRERSGRVERVPLPLAAAAETMYQALAAPPGRLWISTMSGILLLETRPGGAPRVLSHYTAEDGMVSSEASADAQPGGWRAEDGTVYFATIRGVAMIPPRAQPSGAARPAATPVLLERLRADGVEMPAEGPVRTGPGHRLLEIEFAALRFRAPGKVTYRYRMEGSGGGWTVIQGEGKATYHNLPAGDYRFEAQAAFEDGEWGPASRAVEVRIAPFFYQTGGFAAGLALAAAGMLGGLWRMRTLALRREFAAVLAERVRIAREIHDTLLQGFAGAALQLGAMGRRLRGDPEGAERELEVVLGQIDECLAEARREIGELREEERPGPLGERLELAARQALAGSGLRLRFEARGREPELAPEVEKQLLRIVREASANAARHSQGRNFDLLAEFGGDGVRLIARDDGAGMETNPPVGRHFGLPGMRERTRLLGGEFRLVSEPGAGTRIEVSLPAPRRGRWA